MSARGDRQRERAVMVTDYSTWSTASEALITLEQWNRLRLTRGLRRPVAPELLGRIAALEVRWTDEPRGCWRQDVASRCIELPRRADLTREELREAIAHALGHSIVALEGIPSRSHDAHWRAWARKLGGCGHAPVRQSRVIASCTRCGVDIRGRRALNEFQLTLPHRANGCGGAVVPA